MTLQISDTIFPGNLTGLLNNNPEYYAIIQRYDQKIAVAGLILTESEFWQEELDRIKSEFIKPIEITVFGDFKKGAEFNFTDYVKKAYDWIKRGEDWSLQQIQDSALADYTGKFSNRSFDKFMFHTSILISLRKGVGYALYEKFLKDKIREKANRLVHLGTPGVSYSVYELIELLKIKGCELGYIYEIHDPTRMEKSEPFSGFVERTKNYYSAFVNPSMVDVCRSNQISFAVKIDHVWYFAEDVGSNNYLGTGPTSIIDMRKYAYENGINIMYVEKQFDEWKTALLENIESEQMSTGETIIDKKTAYQKINRLIKLAGNELTKYLGTASGLGENDCRNYFIAGLITHAEYDVSAEAENRIGRTDMIVLNKKFNYRFIYEFKIHKQNKDIDDGLQQIINQYSTLTDTHNGLVVLNRKQGDVARIMNYIQTKLSVFAISSFTQSLVEDDLYTLQVTYPHPRDSRNECMLTIFVFDIQLNRNQDYKIISNDSIQRRS